MSAMFRPVTVEPAEVERLGGLMPLGEEEIIGLAALLTISEESITRLPLYRTLTAEGKPGPSFKTVVEELMRRMPGAHLNEVISPYFTGEKIDESVAKGQIEITERSGKSETITIYYKYHSTW